LRIVLATTLAGTLGIARADEAVKDRPQANATEHREAGKGVLRLLPADAVTEHSIDTPRGRLAYTATAGTLAFYDQSGEQSASVFYTAYVAKDAPPNRPLTFVFNGGPGAASAFLHLGLVGPRILDFGPDGHDPTRASVQSDAGAMAKAIALYVAKNNRAGSPKYLFGESYGGFRAAKTARALQSEQGILISGIVMLSPLLEGWLTFGDDQSALNAALQLPSLAAAELERKNAFSPDALAAAEKFAMTDYLTTLAGAPPKGEAAKTFYERVAKMAGLPVDAVTQARGFAANAYVKTLRAPEGKIVSRYDATFAVDDPYPERRSSRSPDPILDVVTRAYGGAMASYARNELGFKTEMTYTLLASDVHWDWQSGGRLQASAEDDLRTLLAYDPSFRLLVAHGYSDMITPYAMTRYVLDHMPPFDPPGRAQLKLYRGGHMIYLDPQSRKAFTADASAFYRGGE
jgi:carboxypeptidase C (cathepsin A)